MMKSIKVFTALVLALGFLGSCGQNLNEPELQPQGDVEQGTQIAYVELEGGTSSDDLRISEIVNPTTGASIGMAMAEHLDLNVRVAVRRGNGTPVYQTLRFKKISGNKVTYKGNIQIPSGGSGAYQLLAVVLSEEGGRTFGRVDGSHANLVHPEEGRLEHIHRLNNDRGQVTYSIPYTTNWQNITVSADGKRISPITLPFKANCTLLRIRLTNSTTQNQTIKALKLVGNAFTTRWSYNLAGNLDAGNLKFGVSRPNSFEDKEFNLPAPITLRPNQKSDWYYIWGMPNKRTTSLVFGVLAKTSGNEYIYAFKHEGAAMELGNIPVELNLRGAYLTGDFDGFGNGHSLPDSGPVGKAIGSDFPNGRMPLEYVAHSNLVQSGDAFAAIQNSGTGYFRATQETVDRLMRGVTIDGKRYSLPSELEMKAIFPNFNSIPTPLSNNRAQFRDITFEVEVGRERMICTSDAYFDVPNRTVYWVLFKGGNGRNLIARKYEMHGNWRDGDDRSVLLVTSRYLGVAGARQRTTQNALIDMVREKGFWDRNQENDVTVQFACVGKKRYGELRDRGQGAYYLTSSLNLRSGIVYSAFFLGQADGDLGLWGVDPWVSINPGPHDKYIELPVRPFRRF